jgi:glycolate oxidase FAD binding subunit
VHGALVEKLRGIVGPAHVAEGIELSPYAVDGRTPEAAVFPGSPEEVSAVVACAADAEIPVMPWGGGTAVGLGTPPVRPGIVLGLRRLDRLVEHEPGDLTATVQAGITLARLQGALRDRGQWLSLDPDDADRATVGGIVAANGSGPRRHLYGTARDVVIGLTVVTADGAIVRGGGKVVKNVAGYDLPKLFVGSYGTLGVLVEVTARLRPLPDAEKLVGLGFERIKDAGAAVRAMMASDLIPNALELVDGEAARVLGLPAVPALIVGFDGLAEQVAWQCAELERLAAPLGAAGARELPPETWGRLASAARAAGETPAAVMTLVVLPAQVADVIEQGAVAARARGLGSAWTAHAGVGVVRGALFSARAVQEAGPIAAALGEWREIARGAGGHATLDWAPLALKAQVAVWDDSGAAGRVMRRIKAQLDPKNILNPGRFVAGI